MDKNGWISVEERLPVTDQDDNYSEWVLFTFAGLRFIGRFDGDRGEFYGDDDLYYSLVTHWQPLPQPPEA